MCDPACHSDKAADDLFHFSEYQIIDHILFFISDRIESFIVVIMFPSEIHFPFAVSIIIDPIAAGRILTDIERQMFVKRIAVSCFKAHGVISIQFVSLMILIDTSGLITQAVDILLFFSSCIMDRSFSQFTVKIICQSVTILTEDPLCISDSHTEVHQFNFKVHSGMRETDCFIILIHFRRAQLKTFQRQLVSSFDSNVSSVRVDAESRKHFRISE